LVHIISKLVFLFTLS